MNFIATVMLIFTLNLGLAKDVGPLPKECQTSCATPFGQILGITSSGVQSYSNCKSHCVYKKPVVQNGTFLGIEWQCVEFARRWLYKNKQAVYPSIDFAFQIWDLEFLVKVKDQSKIKLFRHGNGATARPQVGDLLIYSKAFEGTGHVAIVTKVDDLGVQIGEQNNKNLPWPGNYAREIPLIKKGNLYWLQDKHLLGWMSY